MKKLLILMVSMLALASCSNDDESTFNPNSLENTRWTTGEVSRCGRDVTWEFGKEVVTETYKIDFGELVPCEVTEYKFPYTFDGDTLKLIDRAVVGEYKVKVTENTLTFYSEGMTNVWYKY